MRPPLYPKIDPDSIRLEMITPLVFKSALDEILRNDVVISYPTRRPAPVSYFIILKDGENFISVEIRQKVVRYEETQLKKIKYTASFGARDHFLANITGQGSNFDLGIAVENGAKNFMKNYDKRIEELSLNIDTGDTARILEQLWRWKLGLE